MAEGLEVADPKSEPKPYDRSLLLFGVFGLPVILFGLIYVVSTSLNLVGKFGGNMYFEILLSSVSFIAAALIYTALTGEFGRAAQFLKLKNFRWSHMGIGLCAAIVVYAAAFLIGIAAAYLGTLDGAPELGENSTSKRISEASVGLAAVAVGLLVTVLAPVAEELFFRGALLTTIVQDSSNRWIRAIGITVVAAVFGLFHMQGPLDSIASVLAIVVPGLVGLAAALLTLKFDSLYPAIFTHLFYNGIVFLSLAS